jgi:hypothetical protein
MLYLLYRKLSRIALLEIDHSQDRAYPSISQPRCRDLFDSHVETTHSHPVIEELNHLPLGWYSLFLSKCFCSVMLFLIHRYRVSIHIYIERDISHAWIGANTPFQPIEMRMHIFSPSSFGPHTDHINWTSPSWRLLIRIKSLHTEK